MVTVLPNGLTAVLVENRAAPVVALQAWVKVGAADESAEEAGLAHLHEHMLFKGTARRALGQIAREVEGRGGQINAWTSHDQTVYHLVLADAFLSDGVDLLADALRASAFDEDELRRETQVVVEEIKRSDDSPQRQLSRALFETAYQVHPYRLPVIGTPESVLGFSREQILAFYRRHYRPGNVVLVAVGAFDEAQALAEVERHFGDWSAVESPLRPRTPEPAPTGPRFRQITAVSGAEAFRESRLAIAFHIPSLLHPDIPALDVLAAVLGGGESARLPRQLKRGAQLFSEIYAYGYTPRDAGLWVAGGTPVRDREDAALTALLAELVRVREGWCTPDELKTAQRLMESEQVYQRETVQGWARKVGFYQTMAGSLEAEADYQARVQAVTTEDLQRVARRYLTAEAASLVVLAAEGANFPVERSSEQVAELLSAQFPMLAVDSMPTPSQRPWVTAPRTAADPLAASARSGEPLVTLALSGGATLLVKREPEVPLVAIRAAYLGGTRRETEADNGITALLSRSLTGGARGRSADQIAAATDQIAGSLQGVSGRNSFGLRSEFLARHLEEGLALFTDALWCPDFPEGEVERERTQQLQEIHTRRDNPSGLAFDLFAKTLFTVHPNRLPMEGEAESVARLGPAQLRETLRREYPLSGLTLAVVGDVRPAAVQALIEAALASVLAEPANGREPQRRSGPPTAEPRVTEPRHARLEIAKAQSHLVVGFLGASFTDPDRYALELLSSILAGQGGRLFFELRDRRSLAYSVTSMSVEGVDPGFFAVYIGTSPEKSSQALAGIREQLERVRQEAVTAEELLRAQRYLIGSHAIGLQRRASLASVLSLDHVYGLGAENHLGYARRLEAVGVEQISAAARRFLDPRGEVVVEVGP